MKWRVQARAFCLVGLQCPLAAITFWGYARLSDNASLSEMLGVANHSLGYLMNNAHAEHSSESNASHLPNRKERTRPEDPIRDFFRRGDRGQYEGGPADRLDSLPTWDMPEKPQLVVRTPQQQARRRALIRLEAALLSGCIALLVMAARARSTDAKNNGNSPSAQLQSQTVKASETQSPTETPALVMREAPLLPKPVEAAPPKTNLPAVVVPAPVQAPPAPSARSHEVAAPEKGASVSAKKAPLLAAATKPAAPSAPRSAPAPKASLSSPAVAPAFAATAPKRAVAAFPDD